MYDASHREECVCICVVGNASGAVGLGPLRDLDYDDPTRSHLLIEAVRMGFAGEAQPQPQPNTNRSAEYFSCCGVFPVL